MSKKLHIGSLNINGDFVKKCKYVEFRDLVLRHDIFLVQESWLKMEAIPQIQGYDSFRSDRKSKSDNGKGSGGVLVYFRNSMHKYITKIPSTSADCLWLKLDKYGFGLARDYYICCTYIVPRNSIYFQPPNQTDKLQLLCNEIIHFKPRGSVILIGDFNSRVAEIQEQHTNFMDTYQHQYPELDNDETNNMYNVLYRHNMDKNTNQNGTDLSRILNDSHMYIINGRCNGDLNGSYTYHGPNGSSAIDLCITSDNTFNQTLYFKVLDPVWYSDHCPISLAIKVNRKQTPRPQADGGNISPISKRLWNIENEQAFVSRMSSRNIQIRLTHFKTLDSVSSDEATTIFSNILTNAASDCNIKQTTPNNKTYQGDNYRQDFNPAIQSAKRDFKKCRRQFCNNVHDVNKRILFLAARKKYKTVINQIRRCAKESKLHTLAKLEKKDPKLFWKGVKDLIKEQRDQQYKYHVKYLVKSFQQSIEL